jgi:VCBS repeat-containing protein
VSFQVTANNPAFFSVQPAIDAAGVLSFTLAKDVNGVVTVDVTAIDNGASQPPNVNTSTTHRLSIVIGAVNDPPGFVLGGNISRDEDSGPFVSATPFVTKIVGAEGMNNTPPTGTDEAGQSVTLLTTNSNNALFSVQPAIDSTGRLTFTSAPDASGFVEVYVVGVDNGPSTPPNVNRSQRQVFTIELKPLNDAPFAVNDSYATSEDDLLSIAAPGVLANDRDVDLPNDTLQVVTPTSGSLTSTLGAIVVLNADGSFTYAPRGSAQLQRLTIGETVVDTFTYTIRDLAGALSNLGTVSITVTGINDNPVAVNDSFRVAAGLPTLLDVLANDTDIDSSIDVRTVEIGRIPSNGRVVVLPTGRVEYTPTAGFVGQDSFTYRFRDSLGAPSNEATVIVNSSNPPVAVDDTFTVVRNTPTVIDVLRNDFDPDQGGALDRTTLTIASGPDVGTAVILADGTIRYTPSTGFSGTATFQYFVSDTTGQPSNLARVTLNVVNSLHQNPVNKMDVNDDGFVSPIDVLFIVNDINFNGFRPLPDSFGRPPFLDVNGNGGTDALDVLEIINFINSVGSGGAGEGEASGAAALMSTQVDVEIMSQQAFVELRQREEKLTQDILHELTLAAVLEREMEFGPALPLSSRIDEEDSLADYLARLRTVGTLDDESTDLDGIFSGDAWL